MNAMREFFIFTLIISVFVTGIGVGKILEDRTITAKQVMVSTKGDKGQ